MTANVRAGLILGSFVLAAIILLSVTQGLTRDRIELARAQWLLHGLSEVLPEGPFDNDPLDTVRWINAPELGGKTAVPVYTVFRNRVPLAAVLSVIAPDGYNGDIDLLLGITFDGQIIGVRVTDHRETPGLGDDLEYPRTDWITGFNGQSLQTSTAGDWTVKQDGGRYDGFTGATITPRAVINAVYRALNWYTLHRQDVYDS
jgi:electron transport complex protein RnfG